MVARGLTHQRALGAVTVTAGAKHDDDAAHHMRAQRLEGGGDGVRRVGVIDKHRRTILAGGGALHPAPHTRKVGEAGKNVAGRCAGRHDQCRREGDVFRLKTADQVEPGLVGGAFIGQPQVLAAGIEPLGDDPQIRIGGVADADDALAFVMGNLGQLRALGVVQVDHCHALGRQNPGEQAGFGGEIGREGFVIIEVVLGEIGETGGVEAHAVQAALVKTVRGGLNRGVGDTGLGSVGQHGVQGDRVGRGVGTGRLPRALDPGGADVDRGMAQLHPDLAAEGRGRGFAVGAGDSYHGGGLVAEPQGCGAGEGLARVLRHHKGCGGCREARGGEAGADSVGQDGCGTVGEGGGNIGRAMAGSAGQGCEQEARADRAAVSGEAGQDRVAACPC